LLPISPLSTQIEKRLYFINDSRGRYIALVLTISSSKAKSTEMSQSFNTVRPSFVTWQIPEKQSINQQRSAVRGKTIMFFMKVTYPGFPYPSCLKSGASFI
jgi:hypothetical protein